MKKLLLALLALSFCVETHALTNEIVVYKHKLTVNRTGSGLGERRTYYGTAALNLDTGNFTFILKDKKRKTFSILETATASTYIDGPGNHALTWFHIESGGLNGLSMKGINHQISYSHGTLPLPIAMSASGSGVNLETNGVPFPGYALREFKGQLVYSRSETKTALESGFDLANYIAYSRFLFAVDGYIEELNFPVP